METLTVTELAGPQKKTSKGDSYWPAKAGGTLYYFSEAVNVGDVVQCDVRESTYKNKQGRTMVSLWAKVMGGASSQQSEHGNGKHGLNQFEFAEAVEFWWDKIKPFELADEAKASVLCTLLIATADGRINYELPPDEPETDPFA